MSVILDSLRSGIRDRQTQIDTARRVQVKRGTLCDVRGRITGVSLNSNGNRAYTLVSGVGVVNAWIRNASFQFTPGVGVSVQYDQELGRYYITGTDADAWHAAGASVQMDNPMAPGNLYMDSAFVLDFLSQPVLSTGTSTVVEVKPGVLYANGKRYEYNGGQVDLSSYVASSGNHSILQLWYDPDNDTIAFTQSTEQTEATAFDSTDWDETLSGASTGWLPLQSYEMLDTSGTVITQANKLRDNRPMYTLPFSASAAYQNPLTSNLTLLSGTEMITRGVQREASGVVRTTLGIWWDL